MSNIPITKPYFTEEEERLFLKSLRSGWIVQGPKVQEFENLVASHCGARFGIATTSCTTALHLSLLALGVGPGDEVVLPSFTFVATANAVEYCGAKPVFCDIDLRTLNADLDDLERRITPKTKGLLPVSLFGRPLDMDRLLKIASKRGLRVLEDAACALGAIKDGRHVGGQGAAASTFSFHPRKVITTGEGGMIVTDDEALASLVRSLRDHGAGRSDLDRHKSGQATLSAYDRLGYNYRMTDLQAAIGVAQMDKLDTILASRRKAAAVYDRLLQDLDTVLTPPPESGGSHGYQSYVVLLSPGGRKTPSLADLDKLSAKRTILMDKLQKEGIGVRQGTHAVHTLGYYRSKYGTRDVDFPNALLADRLAVALPLFHGITENDQARVVEAFRRFLCAE
jgi:dTDP-4-amino-4,6-dideoxygalactose transaminase